MKKTTNSKSGILKAYVVPHPPIILPEIGQGRELEISKTIAAMQEVADEIAEIKPQTIIVTSPHAPMFHDAFYLSYANKDRGDMAAFGFPEVSESVDVDLEMAELILLKAKKANVFLRGESAECNQLDHGSLVPLRFICHKYSDFKLLRLGLSSFSANEHYQLGKIIAAAVRDLKRRVIFLASGDLSHVLKEDGPYGFKEEGPEFDAKVIDILERAAFDELMILPKKLTEPAAQCGLGSFQIMAGALAGQEVRAKKLSYQDNFGVGYAVMTFDVNEKIDIEPHTKLARDTIKNYIEHGQINKTSKDTPNFLLEDKAAVFVSLHYQGKLRGCIGTVDPVTDSLAKEIQQNAISAATKDPRFPPLSIAELSDLEISVDVLSPAEKITDTSLLDPKKYGIIVSKGHRRGVLLPDLEGVDTAEEQLSIALQKAGISSHEQFTLERFEVTRYE